MAKRNKARRSHETAAGRFHTQVVHRSEPEPESGWWVENDITPDVGPWGPYQDPDEAEEAVEGCLRSIERAPHVFRA